MVEVKVNEGLLRGKEDKIKSGRKYISFKGIPYAEPPVGNLRFKNPIPKKPWSGVRQATEHGPICLQASYPFTPKNNDPQSEDCLYLNVYTPNLSGNLPVMIWIHGGAWILGSGNSEEHSPDVLLQKDVVLVTINYRLEAFGFLSLNIPEAPGNVGLKDQSLAMRWVKNNITNFGGDSNNITIFGESAGSWSVGLHLISPLSRGLFHKAILQSGCPGIDDTMCRDPAHVAFSVGRCLGKQTDDPEELLEFLLSVDADKLKGIGEKMKEQNIGTFGLVFLSVIEEEGLTESPFMTQHPIDYIVNGEAVGVPVLAGFNTSEGVVVFSYFKDAKNTLKNEPEKFIFLTEIQNSLHKNEISAVRSKLRKTYSFDDLDKLDENGIFKTVSDIAGDSLFTYPMHRYMNFYSELGAPVYMYYFDYKDMDFDDKSKMIQEMFKVNVPGATHASDVCYLFKYHPADGSTTEQVVNFFRDIWTSFAYSGNPSTNVKWKQYKRNDNNYLVISDKLEVKRDIFKARISFFDELFEVKGLKH